MLYQAVSLGALALSTVTVTVSASSHSRSPRGIIGLPLLARSPASAASASTYTRPKPNLARWAEYSRSGQAAVAARRARRGEVIGVPQPKYSPLPPLNGETITKTVAQQIKVGCVYSQPSPLLSVSLTDWYHALPERRPSCSRTLLRSPK